MRVVQLLTQADGGPVDHATDVAAGLARRGADSHVIGPESAATARAVAAGVTWHALHVDHKGDLRGASSVARRLRALDPDVLHLQDRRAGLLGRVLAGGLRRTGVVYTLHGVADGLSDLVAGNALAAQRRRRDRFYYLTLERALARLGGQVVVPSRAVADFATRCIGLREQQVVVVPNGVDPDRFRPGPRQRDELDHEPQDEWTAVWLGGLVPVKRPELALEVTLQVPGLRLRVLGDGPLLPELRTRVLRLGLGSRVQLVGRVDDPGAELAGADAYLLTSIAENCPLSLLQAMATGLPVVVPAVGGVPEVVRDEVDGLLYPAAHVPGLVAQVRRLEDADLRRRLGCAARRRVLGAYTLDHCLDGLVRVYEEVVS